MIVAEASLLENAKNGCKLVATFGRTLRKLQKKIWIVTAPASLHYKMLLPLLEMRHTDMTVKTKRKKEKRRKKTTKKHKDNKTKKVKTQKKRQKDKKTNRPASVH